MPSPWFIRPGIHAFDLAPVDLLDLARAADGFGFDTFWLGEHVVSPARVMSVHPGRSAQPSPHSPVLGPGAHLADLWVELGGLAAVTDRIQLVTGVCVAPLRHPLVTAQAAATVARLSGGRFSLGVGAGWLSEEFDALAADFEHRGLVLDETLAILRMAWRGGPFAHRGAHFSFDELVVTEEPIDIPLVVGGNSAPALRRLAAGDGWFSSGTPTLEQACILRDQIRAVRADDAFRTWFRVERVDRATVARYVDLGFDDLVFHVDQHVAARCGGWEHWLDLVLDSLTAAAAAKDLTRSATC